jgi:hypothetical protein
MLPSEEGSCFESQIKYYFDRTKLTCVPFEYSGNNRNSKLFEQKSFNLLGFIFKGCGGNENNFNSLSECESSCHPIIHFIPTDDKSKF